MARTSPAFRRAPSCAEAWRSFRNGESCSRTFRWRRRCSQAATRRAGAPRFPAKWSTTYFPGLRNAGVKSPARYPAAGLAVGIVRAFVDAVKRIRDTGVAVLLVEQNLEIASSLADSCIVLAAGRVVWRGSARDAT